MSNQYHSFQPKKSSIFVVYTIVLYLFAIGCVWFTFSGLTLFFLLTIIFLISKKRENRTIISLQYDKETEWILQLTNETIVRTMLLPTSVMWRYLCILHFESLQSKERTTLILFADSLSSRDFQLLRRCVRMGYI